MHSFGALTLPSTNSLYSISSGRYSYLRQIQVHLREVLVVTALGVCPDAFLRRLTSTFDNGIADSEGPQHSFGEIILPSTNSLPSHFNQDQALVPASIRRTMRSSYKKKNIYAGQRGPLTFLVSGEDKELLLSHAQRGESLYRVCHLLRDELLEPHWRPRSPISAG